MGKLNNYDTTSKKIINAIKSDKVPSDIENKF